MWSKYLQSLMTMIIKNFQMIQKVNRRKYRKNLKIVKSLGYLKRGTIKTKPTSSKLMKLSVIIKLECCRMQLVKEN